MHCHDEGQDPQLPVDFQLSTFWKLLQMSSIQPYSLLVTAGLGTSWIFIICHLYISRVCHRTALYCTETFRGLLEHQSSNCTSVKILVHYTFIND